MIQASINNWVADRKVIEEIFVENPQNFADPVVVQKCANQIVHILDGVTKVNAHFIEITAEELLDQLKKKEAESKKPQVRPSAQSKRQTKGGKKRKSRA